MPRIPEMLDTRVARLEELKPPWTSLTSPMGRSITKAGASGDEGEVKV